MSDKSLNEIAMNNLVLLQSLEKKDIISASQFELLKPEEGFNKTVDYAYLGAWNFKKEIFKKEKTYINNGGKFITHVPYPKII